MKLYITYKDGVWGTPAFRNDLLEMPKAEYNAEGIFDLEPNPGPDGDLNVIITNELYLDDQNVARYNWTVTPKTGEALEQANRDKWAVIRDTRNRALQSTDYTQLEDAPISAEDKAAWATYRQALRDVTNQQDPFQIVWPTSPLGTTGVTIGVSRV